MCPSSTSGMKDSGMEVKSTEDDSRDGRPCVVKKTMKDITVDTFSKNVNQT